MIEVIIFDLDNTLYDERAHLQCAFKKIARYLADKYNFKEFEVLLLLKNILAREDPTYPFSTCSYADSISPASTLNQPY